jgi:hypothetical protein
MGAEFVRVWFAASTIWLKIWLRGYSFDSIPPSPFSATAWAVWLDSN